MNQEQQDFWRLLQRTTAEFDAMTDDEFSTLLDSSQHKEVCVTTSLATKPASVMRTYTQQVRDHTAAMQRLQDQYFAALKRAEAQYFEGVKRITDALTQTDAPIEEASTDGGAEHPTASSAKQESEK